ncbi:class I adenylate-forming enzyme family protein [Qaidamihabitans albus]|uniref:class I adenylate-forming enzyme family protein n=1 Tax=Qaidamihabitans albus TaxID=2795733 RepID=UPI0018F1AC9D|nr:long-chain fatty acid--CoA ligase [Qaidamihabitans albus]
MTPEPAVVEPARKFTRAELDELVCGLAAALAAHGAGPNGRVGWMMGNRAEVLAVALAARGLGAPVVAFGRRCTRDELAGRIRIAGPSVIVVDAVDRERVRAAAGDVPVLDVDTPLPTGPAPRAPVGTGVPDRLGAGASLLFTSGTSGSPKAALRTRGDRRLAETIADGFGIGQTTRFVVSGPLAHSGPWTCSLMALARGGTVGILPGFDADGWLGFAAEQAMNSGFLTPTQVRLLVRAAGAARGPRPALDHVVVSGEPFPDELRLDAVRTFGPGFVECYGSTELGPLTALPAREFGARPGSSGRPFAGVEVAAFHEGERLGPGEEGVLHARTPLAFDGYVGSGGSGGAAPPGAGDGWATVRDVGFVDPDGYVHVTGRADDMIISGGVNMFPSDIETVVNAHPAVRACAVFGLADPVWGQRVAAAVISDRDVGAEELREWLRGRISDDKRPYDVLRVAELPVTANGKVSRRKLARLARAVVPGHRS